eukprot:4508035-Pyramimonas_sp.AAC.1
MASMAHVGLYRSVFHMAVKNNVEEHVQDAAVWIWAQRLPTDVVFTVARPRYLARVMSKASPFVR